jgi:hypothetical protein
MPALVKFTRKGIHDSIVCLKVTKKCSNSEVDVPIKVREKNQGRVANRRRWWGGGWVSPGQVHESTHFHTKCMVSVDVTGKSY